MSTPSPLVPEGSLQQSKGKSNVRIAIFTILAIHVVLLGGLLIQGCKPSNKTEANNTSTELPPISASATETASTPLPTDSLVSAPAEESLPLTSAPVPVPATVAPAPAPVTAAPAPVAVTSIPAMPQAPAVVTDSFQGGDVKTHTVAKGEMLSTIAKNNRISLKALMEANPTVNPTKLQIGQKLNIPAPAPKAEAVAAVPAPEAADVYTVKPGDALEKIARNNGTSVKAIKALNNLKTDRINAGQKLKLPVKGVEAAGVGQVTPAPFTVSTVAAVR